MGRTACTEPQCLYKGAFYLFFYITLQYLHLRRCLPTRGFEFYILVAQKLFTESMKWE